VDGRFGPRTRSALTWFQIKHGLPRTGTVDVHTLAAIHSRHVPARHALARPHVAHPAVAASTPEPARRETGDLTAIALAVLAALLALVCAVAWRRAAVRGARDVADAGPAARAAPAPAAVRRPPDPPAPAYVPVRAGQAMQSKVRTARAPGSWCERPDGAAGGVIDDTRALSGACTADARRPGVSATGDAAARTRSRFAMRQAEGVSPVSGNAAARAGSPFTMRQAEDLSAGTGDAAARTRSPFAMRQAEGAGDE
jgi:hypothetical protein